MATAAPRRAAPPAADAAPTTLRQEYAALSDYCAEHVAPKSARAPLHCADPLAHPFAYSSLDSPRVRRDDLVATVAGFEDKENRGEDAGGDIRRLALQAAALQPIQGFKRAGGGATTQVVAAPERRHVFRDRGNGDGKGSDDVHQKKKEKRKEKTHEKKQKKEEEPAASETLDAEPRESRTLAARQDEELDATADFEAAVADVLGLSATAADGVEGLARRARDGDAGAAEHEGALRALRAALAEREGEARGLEGRVAELVEAQARQDGALASLACLNDDLERNGAQLVGLLREKDRALADLAEFHGANDRANRRLLTCAHDRHWMQMEEARETSAREVEALEGERARLQGSLAAKADAIAALRTLVLDSELVIASLVKLNAEKDQALADTARFHAARDSAHEARAAATHEQHVAHLGAKEQEAEQCRAVLRRQLEQRRTYARQLALVQRQVEGGVEGARRRHVREAGCAAALVAATAACLALARDGVGYGALAPLCFVLSFCALG